MPLTPDWMEQVPKPRPADKRIIASRGNATWTVQHAHGQAPSLFERLCLLDDEIFRMIKMLEAREQ